MDVITRRMLPAKDFMRLKYFTTFDNFKVDVLRPPMDGTQVNTRTIGMTCVDWSSWQCSLPNLTMGMLMGDDFSKVRWPSFST
jgi:hypothetical protein